MKTATLLLSFLPLFAPLAAQAADPAPASVAAANNPVKTEVLLKSSKSWDGSPMPAYPQGVPEITLLRIKIAPGAKLAMHKHPFINSALVLSGKLKVTTEDNKAVWLKAGEASLEVVDKFHYGENEGPEPVELLVFYAGIAGQPLSLPK